MDRQARTRHLIELGGLVAKSGLPDLLDDDRATILGALLELAMFVRNDDGPRTIARWKRLGHEGFEA